MQGDNGRAQRGEAYSLLESQDLRRNVYLAEICGIRAQDGRGEGVRIAVFLDAKLERAFIFTSRSVAARLLATGQAESFEHPRYRRSIVLNECEKRSQIPCGQERVYEQAGIEKFPQILAGGLTRTENRPAPIPKFQGARVGHG